MCDFNTLDDTQKYHFHQILSSAAQTFGGKNFFLHLLEAIRATKPHPLIASNREFYIELGGVKWNKVIFNDKLLLLLKARLKESEQNNFLPPKEDKQYKNILNLVRTLKPVVFRVTPANSQEGEGFAFEPFEIIDAHTTKLHPLFDALFFCSIETVKKILNYKPATSNATTDIKPQESL